MTHQASLSQRALAIVRLLAQEYPDATCALHYSNALELTVATILSAQCTDERVNAVTPQLFAQYQDAADYAHAHPEELAAIIGPLGFQNRKTKQLITLGQALETRFAGEIPVAMAELTSLPGVGRKTAHVVRSNAFGLPGLSVDTHFGRLTRRWGLTTAEKPEQVERDIAALLPESAWTDFSHRTIMHGRQVCTARKPQCGNCVLASLCPSSTLAAQQQPSLYTAPHRQTSGGKQHRVAPHPQARGAQESQQLVGGHHA